MKTSLYIHTLGLFVGLLLSSLNSYGDQEFEHTTETISIPLFQKNMQSNLPLPTRGSTAQSVESTFGSPLKKHPAKGKPPITKWDYEQFTVYFESSYVIHNVVKNTQNVEQTK